MSKQGNAIKVELLGFISSFTWQFLENAVS